MNVRRYIFVIGIIMTALYACNNDDDNGIVTVPPRDAEEQQTNEAPIIENYLKTHFFTEVGVDLNNDNINEYTITQFDTIAGENSDKTSIWDSGMLRSKTITRNEVDYKLYILTNAEGALDERQPKFADSTFLTYRGELFYDNKDQDGDGIPDEADVDADNDGENDMIMVGESTEIRTDSDSDGIADDSDADTDGEPGTDEGKVDSDNDGIIDEKDPVDNNNPNRRVFDSAITPVWFDLVSVIEGFRESTVDFRGATNFTMPDPNGDGTVSYDMNYGNFSVFIPSGLGYFGAPQNGIPVYSPLIFNIQLYGSIQSDHDNDGIPSYLEDIEPDEDITVDSDGDGNPANDTGDRNPTNDDTDRNGFPNFIDVDDDGDGTPTEDEITVNDMDGNGEISEDEITFYDDDGDGVPNHLDPDDRDPKND